MLWVYGNYIFVISLVLGATLELNLTSIDALKVYRVGLNLKMAFVKPQMQKSGKLLIG